MKNFSKYLTIFLLFQVSFLTPVFADLTQLVSCKESAVFHKRLDNTVKKLEGRLKKYNQASQPALNIQKQIQDTRLRFIKYETEGLLCGKDGLPHLVTDGRWNHSKEFILPGLLFVYITGWIGWVGRKYIQYSATTKNPTELEIIIDVPYALRTMTTGFIWPVDAWTELVNGKLLAKDDEITISPR